MGKGRMGCRLLIASAAILFVTSAHSEPFGAWSQQLTGELQSPDVGTIRYQSNYEMADGYRAYSEITIFWEGSPPEGQRVFASMIDIPPPTIEATSQGICIRSKACGPRAENCKTWHEALRYSPTEGKFIEQQSPYRICGVKNNVHEAPAKRR